jgi:hypothetical protein
MNPRIAMVGSIEANNQHEIDELVRETGLTAFVKAVAAEFDYSGPVFAINTPAGPRRARGLFRDPVGTWFVDTELVARSLHPASEDSRDWLGQQIGGGSGTVHELRIVVLSVGEHFALLTPIDDILFADDLEGQYEEMPASFGWARGWENRPEVGDEQAIYLVANGVPV